MADTSENTKPEDNHKHEQDANATDMPVPVQPQIDLPSKEPTDNPFDPENLRLSQDFGATLGVKKVITTVRCDKPNKHVFVRVRPGDNWRLETGIFEDKVNNGDRYLVDPELWPELAGEIVPVCLFTAITKQNDLFLWPVKLPGADGRTNSWHASSLAAAQLAESQWVRVAANMQAGCYDVYEASGELAEPKWPDLLFEDILRLCFKDRLIEDMDHPCLRALRGEV
jgi:hypothetical protein